MLDSGPLLMASLDLDRLPQGSPSKRSLVGRASAHGFRGGAVQS